MIMLELASITLTCAGMFDADASGTIEWHEFERLWQYVTDWSSTFRIYDLDKNGTIDRNELANGGCSIVAICVTLWFLAHGL